MPLIKIQTSLPEPDAEAIASLLKTLSASLAKHTRKPEAYIMTALQSGVPMTFGGTSDAACYIEVKSVGTFSADQTQAMSQDFCRQVSAALGVPENRTYIEFADAKGYLWGWNGSTFR